MEDDERRSWTVKSSSLGIPMCTPNKYPRRLKRLSLGMPPCIHFFINNHQFVPRCTIFLSLHALCAVLGASCSLLFLVLLFCLLVITMSEPNMLDWERNTLRLNQNSSQDLHAYSFSCELFFFCSQLLICLAIELQFSRSFTFVFRLNFLQVACFILLESFPIALSSVS